MIDILLSLLSRISFKSLINFNKSACSFLNLSCSRPVSCLSLISTIAFACNSESENSLVKFSLALSALDEDFIISITLSILSDAIISPSRM